MPTNAHHNLPSPDHGQSWEDTLLPQFTALLQGAWKRRERLVILIPRETPAALLGNIRQWITNHVLNRPLSTADAAEIAANLQNSLALLERVSATEAQRNLFEREVLKRHRYADTEVEQHLRKLQTACEAVIDAIINHAPMFAVEMNGQDIPTHVHAVDAVHDLGIFTHKAVVAAQATLAQAAPSDSRSVDLTLLKYLMHDLVWMLSKIAHTCAHLQEHLRHPTSPAA
jgi:tRNA pseudouridine-54 N-methylase